MSGRGRGIGWGVALAGARGPTGCRDRSQDATAEAEAASRRAARKHNGLIAFVGSCERDPLWPVLKASARRYDSEMCTLEVRYLCPRNNSAQEQIDLINSVVGDNLRGVCVQIDNLPAIERTLRDLYLHGVKIVS